jgi:NDP-sugar pyrophosphorylase family protein
MKAIIFPSILTNALAPLTDWLPEFLVPVVNKPIVEHSLELLVRSNINDIMLVLRHLPFETEKFFGDGSRWGATISYALPGKYLYFTEALKRVTAQPTEPYLCLPAHMVTDLRVDRFIAAHNKGQGDLTLATATHKPKGLRVTDPQDFAGIQACPMILSPEAVSVLCTKGGVPDLSAMIKAITTQGLRANTYQDNFLSQSIESLQDFLTVNQFVIQKKFAEVIVPGKEHKPGIWVGNGSKIHPQSRLTPPLLIGQHCRIGRSILDGGTIIGDHVIIENDVTIKNSIVLKDTYLGSHIEVKEMVINKNKIFSVPNSITVHIGDEIILGDLGKNGVGVLIKWFLQFVLTLLMLIIFSPLILILCLYHLFFPSSKFLYSEKCCAAFKSQELSGEKTPEEILLYKFKSKNRVIQKLPGLIQVLQGTLNLVGNSPVTRQQAMRLQEEGEGLLLKAPFGLFAIWEAEGGDELSWEEIMVQERYYAATHSVWVDLKILLKCLFPFSRKRIFG